MTIQTVHFVGLTVLITLVKFEVYRASIFSNPKRPWLFDEADATARRIEEETLATASSTAIEEDDGIEILQVYSKHISKLMLEAVKSRSSSGSASRSASASGSARSLLPPQGRWYGRFFCETSMQVCQGTRFEEWTHCE
ncbi:uncharacterized protein LOC130753244 [Actinidia eriantha]|uniref:uncharacterized protein LOC130753244 n=1 Tax=Actinidia eriantha TaxID=165200 RepID=UPI0025873362|nr:uncharacterized protein LOC130753244 [Actinidia eriantha]